MIWTSMIDTLRFCFFSKPSSIHIGNKIYDMVSRCSLMSQAVSCRAQTIRDSGWWRFERKLRQKICICLNFHVCEIANIHLTQKNWFWLKSFSKRELLQEKFYSFFSPCIANNWISNLVYMTQLFVSMIALIQLSDLAFNWGRPGVRGNYIWEFGNGNGNG